MTRLVDILRIMSHDLRTERGIFRIIRLSVWRWYRLGWDGMLEWLDKEVGKLPNNYDELIIDAYTYNRWIKRIEKASFSKENVKSNLLFSIILTSDKNQNIAFSIESVLSQTYSKWELLIVTDKDIFFDDPRVKWIDSGQLNNVERLNTSTKIAKGEWILFLDADSRLSPYALNEILTAFSQNPSLEAIYTDDDRINVNGKRFDPNLKSDFNLDMLYSIDYIGWSFAVSSNLIRKIGEFNPTFLYNPTYDFWLRAMEVGINIVHIQKVLFHYMKVPHQKELLQDEFQALEMHGIRTDKEWEIVLNQHCGTRRIKWTIPKIMPLVTIIIPIRDQFALIQHCIQSIVQKTLYENYEILIVDNQSTCVQTLTYLDGISSQSNINVIQYNYPFNYAAINNFAVNKARGDILLLLNNDIEIISYDWLDEMVGYACRETIGCVGAMLYYQDDTIQHAGVIIGLGDVAGHAHRFIKSGSSGYKKRACIAQNFSAVTGACLAVRKEIYMEVGWMDAENLPVAYNDVDFCLKVREDGYINVWTPYAKLYHYESKSRGKDDSPEKKKRAKKEIEWMRRKWSDRYKTDPYYHPMLTKIAEQFQLRRL